MIETPRLRLLPWAERHRAAFAALHACPEVMEDLGGPIGRAESDRKFDRYVAAQCEHGVSRLAVETKDSTFIGYAGVMPRLAADHPLGAHYEIGWRFMHAAWGQGFATEAARAALDHAVRAAGIEEVIAYTGAENFRSQAVMRKLGLARRPSLDFRQALDNGREWQGLVWIVPAELTGITGWRERAAP